jgi:excisionase family DNA binding protein
LTRNQFLRTIEFITDFNNAVIDECGERSMRYQIRAAESLDSRSDGTDNQGRKSNADGLRSGVPPGFGGQTQPVFEQVLSSEEAAALLKIHPKTLQKLARSGKVPGVRIGKAWAFRASALNRWLESKLAT